MVILFKALKSTHILQVLTLLGTNMIGDPHGEELCQMKPLSTNS